MVVDSNVLTLLADLEAVEASGKPKGAKDVVQFPAKGWAKNASASADAAALAVRARLKEIVAPPGLAFRLTVALNVFAKQHYSKRLPDGSTPRVASRVLGK